MQFSDSYFEDEVRDGFYVPGMMKRAWAAQLEILEDIDRICKKYKIQYFADWGTLLGAVRHHGFIPWDDDMDICMKRADYNRFLSVAQKELPEHYYLLNCHNEYGGEIFWDYMTRVVNGSQISFDDAHLKKFHGFPYVSGIDIFSLDFVAPNEEKSAYQTKLVNLVTDAIDFMDGENNSKGRMETLIKIEKMCDVQIDRKGNIKQQLYFLMERLFSMYEEEEADKIAMMPLGLQKAKYQFPKSYYEDTILLPFENTKIPVPVAYDAILRKKYGNYLKLVRKGGAHDYPFYKRQEMVLEEEFGIRFPKYAFGQQG